MSRPEVFSEAPAAGGPILDPPGVLRPRSVCGLPLGSVLVLVGLNILFFLSSSYIATTNEGSHFALVSALVDRHSVIIDDFVEYTGHVDYCFKDGHNYSDRPPGSALLAVPFFVFGDLVERAACGPLLSRSGNLREIFVLFLPNLAGALVAGLLVRLLLHFGAGPLAATLTMLVCVLGTPIWLESTRFYSHIISMALVLSAAALVVIVPADSRQLRKAQVAAAFLLGFASAVEIQNLLFVGPFAWFLWTARKGGPDGSRCKWRLTALYCAVAFCLAYSILLIYNYRAFHVLTIKCNAYNPSFPEEHSFGSALSGGFWSGLDRLYTSFSQFRGIVAWRRAVRNATPGLFALSPILLASVYCYPRFLRRHRAEGTLFLSLVALESVIAAFHKTVLVRHISTIIPFLAIPGYLLVGDALRRLRGRPLGFRTAALCLGLFALSTVSVAHEYFVINSGWGRGLGAPWRFAAEWRCYLCFYAVIGLALGVPLSLALFRRRLGGARLRLPGRVGV